MARTAKPKIVGDPILEEETLNKNMQVKTEELKAEVIEEVVEVPSESEPEITVPEIQLVRKQVSWLHKHM